MADERIEYEVATKFTGEGELREAANALERVGDTGRRVLGDSEGLTSRAKRGWADLAGGMLIAQAALRGVGDIARNVYGALGEGADLLAAQEKFDNLSVSINTTADSLLGRMREATQGMLTDAQLVASGTEIMSLGLANTEDGVTRLASVIGTLGWDMQQVVLTMANNSMMRLDALGLSMEDVKSRAAALKEEGYSLDEAFDLAVLEAGEAKIELLGNKADTAAGKLQILETSIANAQDEFKTAFAESLTGGIDAAIDSTELLDDAIQRAATNAGTLLGNLGAAFILQFGEESAIKQLEDMGADMGVIRDRAREINREAGVGLIELGTSPQDVEAVTRRYAMLTEEIARLQAIEDMRDPPRISTGNADDYRREATAIRDFATAVGEFNQASNQGAYTTPAMRWDSDYYDTAYGDLYQLNQALIDQQAYARDTAEAWGEYTDAITARGGGFFADFIQEAEGAKEAGQQWAFDLNQSIFDAMAGGGAGADVLAGWAENIGAAGEDIAAAFQAAQEQALVVDLAAGVRDAGIAWSEFPGLVEQALAELEGTTARAPQVMPAPEDLGFREGWQEQFMPQAIEPIEVPLEVQLREDVLNTALDNARGMVEGFTNPDQVYQAVMDMDISAVERGAGEATQLINGIPTSRTITINWQQSGTDVLTALRALGIIP